MTTASLESVRRLSMRDVLELTRWSKAKIHSLLREKKFPPPIKDGGRNFWTAGVIAEHLAQPDKPVVPDVDKFRKLKATYWQEVRAGVRTPPKPRTSGKHVPKIAKPAKPTQ